MEIKFKINPKSLILSIVSFMVAYMTVNGTIQSYINFADAINEIGFFILALLGGVLGLFTSFEKSQSN
jgi:hypothetical protein